MKKRGKKSQITIFIIAAIAIVIIVALFFLYKGDVIKINPSVPDQVTPINNFVMGCVDEVSINAVEYIGQTGGYFTSPDFSTVYGNPYYYSEGKSYIPTIEKIEEELGAYMDIMLYTCTGDFSDYPDFYVKRGEVKSTAKIEENKVTFDIDFPLTITKADKTYTLSRFNGETQVRLKEIYDLAYKINQKQLIDKEEICVSCMYDWSKESDLYVEMNDFGNKTGTIIYTIRDANSKINDRDYRFIFANKFKVP